MKYKNRDRYFQLTRINNLFTYNLLELTTY